MKDKKGFFLAETIVVIAIISSIMLYVFPNVSSIYQNYKYQAYYYDQIEDLYVLKAIGDYINDDEVIRDSIMEHARYCSGNGQSVHPVYIFYDVDNVDNINKVDITDEMKKIGYIGYLDKLYIANYLADLSDSNVNFNRYLNRIVKNNADYESYRLIGVFKEDNETRYASIKLKNLDGDLSVNQLNLMSDIINGKFICE